MRPLIDDSKNESFYDILTPYYREYCRTRSNYIAAIDKLVIENIPPGADSLLDVGAGDGLRSEGLARAGSLSVLVLVEPSKEMAMYCEQRMATAVWRVKAEELIESDHRFDVITCLWNVLGHVPDKGARLAALCRMRSFLTRDGRIFLDVNNRYNGRAYGWLMTLARFFYDLVRPSTANGDVTFDWRLDGVVVQAHGHVFTPREIASLVSEAGLKVKRRFVVDYQSGKLRRLVVGGQLLFELVSSENDR